MTTDNTADLVVGDTGSSIRITCKRRRDGSVIDLTGATVTILWRNEADTADVEQNMTLSDAANGIAEYQFLVGELYADIMTFTFKIVDGGGFILSSLTIVRQIVREADAA